jgi:hypothetical protein
MTAIPDWTVDNVSAWLRSQHLEALVEPFEENYVDGQLLLELDEEMLEELGISSKLQRKRFLLRVEEAIENNITMVSKTAPRPSRVEPATVPSAIRTRPTQAVSHDLH